MLDLVSESTWIYAPIRYHVVHLLEMGICLFPAVSRSPVCNSTDFFIAEVVDVHEQQVTCDTSSTYVT